LAKAAFCSSNVALARHHAKGSQALQRKGRQSAAIAPFTCALMPVGAADGGAEPRQRLL
jgi:hypothetical protein